MAEQYTRLVRARPSPHELEEIGVVDEMVTSREVV
jgi:hypothetical protein